MSDDNVSQLPDPTRLEKTRKPKIIQFQIVGNGLIVCLDEDGELSTMSLADVRFREEYNG